MGEVLSGNFPQKGGRPRKLKTDAQTLETLRGLGEIGATMAEAAIVLRVSERTLSRFVRDTPAAFNAMQGAKVQSRLSLRRAQLRAAQDGNATMLVWLGKVWLGQTDKPEPAEPMSFAGCTDEERRTVEEIWRRGIKRQNAEHMANLGLRYINEAEATS